MKRILLLICGLFVINQTIAQVKLEASLDSSRILIGDQTSLQLKLTQQPTWDALMPIKFDLGEQLEILDQTLTDTLPSSNGDLITTKKLIITAWDSGQVRIPPIPVAFKNPNSNTIDTIYSRPLFLNVNTLAITDSAALKPIKDILKESATFEDYQMYFILAGVLLAMAIFIRYFMRKRPKPAPTVPMEVIQPPHEIALEKLFKLSKEELWQKGEVKQYQSRLTQIIREYVGKRYNILALEATTFDIIQNVKDRLTSEQATKLREILEIADLVKFAKAKPPLEINQRFMDDAVQFVRETKFVPILTRDPETNIRTNGGFKGVDLNVNKDLTKGND